MQTHNRVTVDLAAYPDLTVILLGLEITSPRALLSLGRIGRGLAEIASKAPDGLLHHQRLSRGWRQPGFIQYWRDFESLERFTRTNPHAAWWRHFMAKHRGCGFWHETYSARRGFEAIYVDMPSPLGFGAFAPNITPTGPFASSRKRLGRNGNVSQTDADAALMTDAT